LAFHVLEGPFGSKSGLSPQAANLRFAWKSSIDITGKQMRKDVNERFFSAVLRRRFNDTWRVVVTLSSLAVVGIFAFAHIFTTFAPWDDDGYFLRAFHDFLSGYKLYDQVFAFYGPFTFMSAALIARFDPVNVNEDTFRWALLLVWILSAFLIGGTVWRWTKRFTPAVGVFLLVGLHLRGLAKSVGHPQLWIIFAAALLLWLGLDWIYLPGKWMPALCTGFLIGIILLCKINIGMYVSIAITLAVSLQLKGRLRPWASGGSIIAAASLALLLFITRLTGSEMCFALAYLCSLFMIFGVAFFRAGEQRPIKNLVWVVAGLAICLCAGACVTLACGTTFRALLNSLFAGPAALLNSYHSAFGDVKRGGSIVLSLCGIVIAILTFLWRRHFTLRPEGLGILKVIVGAGLLCLFVYNLRMTLTGSLLFMWLLIFDAQPVSNTCYSKRLFLALLCPLFSLQLFPIAGEQVDWASLMPTVAAAVLFADGINCIARANSRAPISRWTRVVARSIGPALAIVLFLLVGNSARRAYIQWSGAQPVNLPGALWLRLPPAEAARLMNTTSELTSNCKSVLTIPGMYSFSLWSGVPPAEERRINSGLFIWPKEILENELPKVRNQNQGCVLVSKDIYSFFKQFAVSKGSDELLSEVRRTMKPIWAVQDLTLYRSSQKPDQLPNPPD
jgi:hypothetical protein